MNILLHIKEDFKKVQTDEKSLRKFGVLVGAILVAIAFFSGRDLLWIGLLGVLLVAFGVFRAQTLLFPYRAWMMLAVVMGFFMSRILLVVLYYFAILPIGILKRIFGDDPLDRSSKEEEKTYWAVPEKDVFSKEDFEHLY